jgi:flavin reductase (DIM6/NTAB) family NADH-FMN oxidoreductase RutF
MLITAGKADIYNTMTANWGMMGELWNKHVAAVMIRDIHTSL